MTLQGQTAAFEHLVRKYQDRLFNTVLYLAGHAEDARDIVQETLVQAFLKLDTFEQRSRFYTWLYRIAFNLAISHRRRQRPTRSLDAPQKDGRNPEPPTAAPTPAEQVEARERCQQVRQAIAQLDQEHRAVLLLREIDGCDYETIAAILEVPLGTVRSRLHRARTQLRQILSSAPFNLEPAATDHGSTHSPKK